MYSKLPHNIADPNANAATIKTSSKQIPFFLAFKDEYMMAINIAKNMQRPYIGIDNPNSDKNGYMFILSY